MGHSWAEAHGVFRSARLAQMVRRADSFVVQRNSPTTRSVSSASRCLLTSDYLLSFGSLRARRPMTASVYARSST